MGLTKTVTIAIFSLMVLGLTMVVQVETTEGADLEKDVKTLEQDVKKLEQEVQKLQNTIAGYEKILKYINVDEIGDEFLKGPILKIAGANVQILSGSGRTDDDTDGDGTPGSGDPDVLTGLGNLIIGYNEVGTGTWEVGQAGSHNLLVGEGHGFNSIGGFAVGYNNMLTGKYASISGGYSNEAEGSYSSVNGGSYSVARGKNSSVGGGWRCAATGIDSVCTGGNTNSAQGMDSTVIGGIGNLAINNNTSIIGGINVGHEQEPYPPEHGCSTCETGN